MSFLSLVIEYYKVNQLNILWWIHNKSNYTASIIYTTLWDLYSLDDTPILRTYGNKIEEVNRVLSNFVIECCNINWSNILWWIRIKPCQYALIIYAACLDENSHESMPLYNAVNDECLMCKPELKAMISASMIFTFFSLEEVNLTLLVM